MLLHLELVLIAMVVINIIMVTIFTDHVMNIIVIIISASLIMYIELKAIYLTGILIMDIIII